MKKILFLCLMALCTAKLSAQKTDYSTYATTGELRKIYQTVKSNDKPNYYLNYFKLSEAERLQKEQDFKKFDKRIVKQLVDVMYDSSIDLSEESEARHNAIKNLDLTFATNQSLTDENYTDLQNVYNPIGIYSGLNVFDLGVDGNKISFVTSTGTADKNYYHFYKVKGNKLKHMKTLTQKQMQH